MTTAPTLAEALRALADAQDFGAAAQALGLTGDALAAVLREGAATVAPRAARVAPPRPPSLFDERAPALPPRPPAVPEPAAEPARTATDGARYPHVVVFSDGAARGNPGPAGAGAVIALPDGRVVARLGKFLGVQTNNVAEYQGLVLGLKKALELGARRVDVRADSMLVIMQLRGEWKLKHPGLRAPFDEAKALLGRFEKTSLEHVRREQNSAADEMSNRAIDERM